MRMDPQNYGLRPDDELLFSRVRKMITRYIGLLYYALPMNDDRTSLLYNNILSLDDLDNLKEPLPIQPPR